MTLISIGVVGNGFVGRASRCLACPEVKVLAYDLDPSSCEPEGTTLEDVAGCDFCFVSVPTPMKNDKSAYTGIVEEVVAQLKKRNAKRIVIRSTVPPGFSDNLGVYFMPEFLTERNAEHDFVKNPVWVIGTPTGEHDQAFCNLFSVCKRNSCIQSDKTIFMSTTEAEFVKYYRNTFLATKVAFCNEFSSICESQGVDYEKVRSIAAADPRISLSHTAVPGPDGKRGYGGTCFPKDLNALLRFAAENWIPCPLLEATRSRNEDIDRPEKEWKYDIGRAVVKE